MKPDLHKLRVFGCIGFLKISNELIRDKFQKRSIIVQMVGYCPNGYRLYSMNENKIYTGRGVIFNKWKFKFDKSLNGSSIEETTEDVDTDVKMPDEEDERSEDENCKNETEQNP